MIQHPNDNIARTASGAGAASLASSFARAGSCTKTNATRRAQTRHKGLSDCYYFLRMWDTPTLGTTQGAQWFCEVLLRDPQQQQNQNNGTRNNEKNQES